MQTLRPKPLRRIALDNEKTHPNGRLKFSVAFGEQL